MFSSFLKIFLCITSVILNNINYFQCSSTSNFYQVEEVKVCFLYQEMEQQLQKYLTKFVTVAVIQW